MDQLGITYEQSEPNAVPAAQDIEAASKRRLLDLISDEDFDDDGSSCDDSASDSPDTDEEADGDHALVRTQPHLPVVNATVRSDESIAQKPMPERRESDIAKVTFNEHDQGLTIAEAIQPKKSDEIQVSFIEVLDDMEFDDRSDRSTPLVSDSITVSEPHVQRDYFSL